MKIKWDQKAQAASSLRYMSMRGDLSKIKELTINSNNNMRLLILVKEVKCH